MNATWDDIWHFVSGSNLIEGITRAPTDNEVDATLEFIMLRTVTVSDMCNLVNVYAPGHVLRAHPHLNVRVGNHVAPKGGEQIRTELGRILRDVDMTPWEQHVAYEKLHPFTDGNGRSGRTLWLWRHGGNAPLGFLHHFYYQTLESSRSETGD